MAQLAIRGHATKGNEVIEILEMLGGVNDNYEGNETSWYYFINDNHIDWCQECDLESNFISFTLEEFLEKFPYKVGNKVNYVKYNDECPSVYTIQKMRWTRATIEYLLESSGFSALTKDLQPYKEETMENKPDLLQQLKDYFDNTPREVVEKEWHEYDKYNEIGPTVNEYLEYVNKIRQPQYPKTFVECCEILYPNENFQTVAQPVKGHNGKKLFVLQKLLICRDAYWWIAEDWRPEFRFGKKKYCIMAKNDKIISATVEETNRTFVFPTAEIRDAFKENFDDDIEFCKEFL